MFKDQKPYEWVYIALKRFKSQVKTAILSCLPSSHVDTAGSNSKVNVIDFSYSWPVVVLLRNSSVFDRKSAINFSKNSYRPVVGYRMTYTDCSAAGKMRIYLE